MNLIEKLGLEKCKQIVDGAPEGATQINQTPNYFKDIKHPYCEMWNPYDQKWFETEVYSSDVFICLSDIRTALADHDRADHDRTDYVSDIRNHISPMTIVQGDL